MLKQARYGVITAVLLLAGCSNDTEMSAEWWCSYYNTCAPEENVGCSFYGNCKEEKTAACSVYGYCDKPKSGDTGGATATSSSTGGAIWGAADQPHDDSGSSGWY